MELGSETQLNKTAEKSWQFLGRALDITVKPESGFDLDNLPKKIILPRAWQNKIQQVAKKTAKEEYELGTVGYLPHDIFPKHGISWGKLVKGTQTNVSFLNNERRLFFSMGESALDIHGHPPSRFKELSSNGYMVFSTEFLPIPSDNDLASLLQRKSTIISFIILPTDKSITDIDLLVKCQKSPPIVTAEDYGKIQEAYNSILHKSIIESVKNRQPMHLVDFKRLFSAFSETYQVGYYSSYDLSSATHQDLSGKQPIYLTRIFPQ